MTKQKLSLNSNEISEIKASTELLKNCTALPGAVCIALQRNFKTAKEVLDTTQEALDILRENWQTARKEEGADIATLDKNYVADTKAEVNKTIDIELTTFMLSQFPTSPKSFGTKEIGLQGQNGEVKQTTVNFYEAFLPLVDVLVIDDTAESENTSDAAQAVL